MKRVDWREASLPLSSPTYYQMSGVSSPVPSPFSALCSSLSRRWLADLAFSVEHECMSILYAKSLLEMPPPSSSSSSPSPLPLPLPATQRISIGIRLGSASCSTADVSSAAPPPKPQRCIARLTTWRHRTTLATAASSFSGASSSLDLPSSSTSQQAAHEFRSSDHVSCLPSTSRLASLSRTKPPSESRAIRRRSMVPPSYDQVCPNSQMQSRPESALPSWRPSPALRHTIAVNQQDVDAAAFCPRASRPPLPSSPKSLDSSSTASVDSGQCSVTGEAGAVLSSQQSFSSREEKDDYHDCLPSHNRLPGYARMASTMDHVLRTSSAIYTLLSRSDAPDSAKNLLAKVSILLQIIDSSPFAASIKKQEVLAVRQRVHGQTGEWRESPALPAYTTVLIRSMLQHILQLFARIVSRYLSDCSCKDRLLVVALEHLIHICLFGDELCLETIECGGVEWLLRLAQQRETAEESRRLALRALAVLCALGRGCLQLIAMGGLPVVLSTLSSPSIHCSVEAAGILTQLTNPAHCFVHISNVESVIGRLLRVLNGCESAEAVLLVTAALSNVSHSHSPALYEKNAVQTLVSAYRRKDCASVFVQEQLATIFSRLAASHYEDALIAQGAVPILLEMLSLTDKHHSDYSRRIRYKAAVCIGTLAATGVGLKALHSQHAYAILCHVLEMESSPSNPLHMICTNIMNRLICKYRMTSAV